MLPLRPSWSRFPSLVAAVLLPLAFACTAEDPFAPPPRDREVGFEPREGLDPSAWLRPANLAFHSGVVDMTTAPDGSTWLVRHEWRDRTFYGPGYWMLSHLDPAGNLLAEFEVPEGVRRVVAHPSGELTVVGWELSTREELRRTTVQLRRLGPDGAVMGQRNLRSTIPPEERLAYGANAEGYVYRITLRDEERFVTVTDIVASGEDVYLLTAMDGMRVMRLDHTLSSRWVRVVAPSLRLEVNTVEAAERLGPPFRNARLTLDEAGRPHVAVEFPPVSRLAYWDAFARMPEGPEGKTFLLTSLESTGEPGVARTVAAGDTHELVDVDVRSGAFALGARVRSPLLNNPDKGFDADLFFASGRLDRPASEDVSRVLTLENDDEPEAFVACGESLYCFAGHTGHVTLNTQRTVSEGQGFVLAVDARGEPKSLTRIGGPRDTRVEAAVAAPGGAVVFALTTNEAVELSEVPNHEKNNELWLGRLNTP